MNATFEVRLAMPKVLFGWGALERLPEQIEQLGARRALVLCTSEQAPLARRVCELLGDRAAGVFAGAVMHVPMSAARAALRAAQDLQADCAVAVGGGSTTGLGKAIALESWLPIVAVPTTYAGSEMTPIYGLTDAGLKRTGRDLRVLPKAVVYDPQLTLGLPVGVSVASGLNAIAHAAEGLYAHDGNPLIARLAEDGIAALAQALPRLRIDPPDRDARTQALQGAWLCGAVLGHVSMGLHHKLCHTLGGSFNLPHAETHAVMLPHALAYNAPAAPQAMRRLARALQADDAGADDAAAVAVQRLAASLGAPASLRAIGMPADGLDRAADLAVEQAYPNPRPLQRDALRALLQRAFDGASPQP